MNTILTRKIAHPWRWLSLSVAALLICAFSLILYSKRHLWKPTFPLDEILWTSDLSYQTFYGPGTPQSLALANQIKSLKEKGYLSEDIQFDAPVYIAPLIFDSSTHPEDPFIIVNFTSDMAKSLKKSHKIPKKP